MKKLFIVLVAVFSILLVSCDNREALKSEIAELEATKANLERDCNNASIDLSDMTNQIGVLEDDIRTLGIYKRGGSPKYIIRFELKQTHYTLDIGEHIKDSMNSIKFNLPVDKEFYDSINIGEEVVDDFRMGSFVINGSLGNWKMIAREKFVEE